MGAAVVRAVVVIVFFIIHVALWYDGGGDGVGIGLYDASASC